MVQKVFIGRKLELSKLKAVYQTPFQNLVAIKGRRRIGKSRLITEFAAQTPKARFFSFAGLAMQDGVTAQDQRDHFARQFASHINSPPMTFQNWSDAFNHLSCQLQAGDIILFDEISWMGAKDPTFIPKLKAWWDWWNLQPLPVLLVLCGSVSTWIEENILNNTALFGRISLTLTLEPLSITESAELLRALGSNGSFYDCYKLLAILGGIPWYLEQISPNTMADEAIKRLCFQKDGLLVLEFDRIFHDLFNGKGAMYKQILGTLKDEMKTLADIRTALKFSQSGTLSQMMEHLITAGFVAKQELWSIKTEQQLKQSLYRISDPYMRFYLKVIEPNRNQIDKNAFTEILLTQLTEFETHFGLQMKYLLLQNRRLLLNAMSIPASEVIFDGPYRQFQTTKKPSCQIDYLVQTKTKNLFLCEFKFKRRELGIEIVDEVKEKMNRLKVPRGHALVPMLFHLGDVAGSVYSNGMFYRIIDIKDFLGSYELGVPQ